MEQIAQVYARSLFEVAKEQDALEPIKHQLDEIAAAVKANRDLSLFFFSPYFSTEEKLAGLERTVVDAHPALMNFLRLLVENHRMPALDRVRREFDALWQEEHKLLPVQVTSAVALDRAVVDRIGMEIGQQTGRNVELTSGVDPDILGGIVVRVGNSILDASIRTRLDTLRKQVAQA